MKIVVPVKYVPEPTSTWSFTPELTLDRAAVEGRLSELDEYAVEQAVRLVEAGLDAEVIALTVGPEAATSALRKALAMGATSGVHVQDDAIAGSDALATSRVLAAALQHVGFDVVVTGMASTDAEMSVMPAMVAQRLGLAQLTFAASLSVDGDRVTVRRDADTSVAELSASTPVMVSVTDQTGEARYPAFKAIMAAKKKPVTTLSLADLGIDAGSVGLSAAACRVTALAPAPPRQAGAVVVDGDDGCNGAGEIAEFLVTRGFL
jgi:electron transfer flavoprotein beta subunit